MPPQPDNDTSRATSSSASSSLLELTRERMENALRILDEEIAKSELLMSVAPLRLITIGGSLAVMLCGNRHSTMDVDVMLDPNVRQAEDYWAEFEAAVREAATRAAAPPNWMNEDLKTFVARDKRQDLFLRSVQAHIRLYTGPNLELYAGDLRWALERKLRRVAHSRQRRTAGKDVDLPDAAALIHVIRARAGPGAPPLKMHEVQNYNLNTFDVPPDTSSLRKVARYYFETYGEDGLAEYAWDDEAGRWKWQGQDGEWRIANPSTLSPDPS